MGKFVGNFDYFQRIFQLTCYFPSCEPTLTDIYSPGLNSLLWELCTLEAERHSAFLASAH